MSQNEGSNPSLERASFPLYNSKKNKTVRVAGRLSDHAQVASEGADQLELVGNSSQLDSARERESSGKDVISGLASASSGDALITPLLSMGFQLPQLTLLMQQPQQQKQSLSLSSNPSSMINTLLFPHSLSSVASDKWPAGLPATASQDGVQKGTIMSAAGVYRSTSAVVVAGKDGQGPTSSAAGKTFGCHLCKDWFFSREKFIMHLVMNHKMLQCRFCSDLFETHDMRETHEAMNHLPLECDACKCSAVHLMEIDSLMYVKNTYVDEQENYTEEEDEHASAWGELVKCLVSPSEQITNVKKSIPPNEQTKNDNGEEQTNVPCNSQAKGKGKKCNRSLKELELEESKPEVVDGQGQTDSLSDASSDDDSLSGSDVENEHLEFSDCGIVLDPANEPVDPEIDPSEVECVINETSDEELFDEEDDTQRDEESGFLTELQVKQEGLDAVLDSLVNEANSQSISQPLELALEEHMKKIFDSTKTGNTSSPAPNGQNWTGSHGNLADGEVKQEPQDVLEDALVLSGNEVTTLNKNGKIQGKKFSCDICLRSFPLETDLSHHLSSVHNFSIMPFADKNKFKCIESCGKVFISKTSLDVHKMEAHNNAKVCTLSFQCPFCTIRSRTKVSIRQHVFSCHSSTFAQSPPCKPLAYRCRCCSDEFWRVEDRNRHQLAEHSDTIESFFKCYMCYQSFTSKVSVLIATGTMFALKNIFQNSDG
ncbi:hypothetical protein PR048_011991 [Dryococelus australis]|uniref:C2H2-type domain-containing protein n=1 Tax=Dryococelus australis TaxID=614101 RepID=A0ABQ9HN75_9NEOP|nr:hypothetical protein PR048_011991 [Dryococelus australis]